MPKHVNDLAPAGSSSATDPARPLVLIVCTGNSCRSQMAEAFLRGLAGDIVEVASAGVRPAGFVHPQVIAVMREAGYDLSRARSKGLEEFRDRPLHTIITVCDRAHAKCPLFPGLSARHHWPVEDPVRSKGTEAEVQREFRRTRDLLRLVCTAYAAGWRAGLAAPAGARS